MILRELDYMRVCIIFNSLHDNAAKRKAYFVVPCA